MISQRFRRASPRGPKLSSKLTMSKNANNCSHVSLKTGHCRLSLALENSADSAGDDSVQRVSFGVKVQGGLGELKNCPVVPNREQLKCIEVKIEATNIPKSVLCPTFSFEALGMNLDDLVAQPDALAYHLHTSGREPALVS